MISVFLREQKRYTQEDLVKEFHCSEEKTVRILKRLKGYGVLKAVKANDTQKDLTDLLDEDIEIADVEVGENEYLYVFTFVGVITIEGRVLKCYPKYLLDATISKAELKQVLKVLEKYNSREQIIRMYNDTSDSSAFNMLAVMLFLLQDYFEYGAYTNTQANDRYVYSNSYFRLRNITLSYTFEPAWLERLHVSGASVFFTATNLFTITDWPGLDPDMAATNAFTKTTETKDVYPMSRSFSFGLKLQF